MSRGRAARTPRWVREVFEACYAESGRKSPEAQVAAAATPKTVIEEPAAPNPSGAIPEPAPVAAMSAETVDGLLDALGHLARHQDLLPRAVADQLIAAVENAVPDGVRLPPRRPRAGQRKFESTHRVGVMARRRGQPRDANPHAAGRGFAEAFRRAWARGWSEEDLRIRRASAPDLYACRMLTMRRPHGRVHDVAE
jgi:hypothetical protein